MKKNDFPSFFPRGRKLKILMTMKLIVFLSCVLSFTASASIYSQNQKVNLDFQGVNVLEAFNEIKAQTGLRFIYNEDKVEEIGAINFDATDMRVDEALEEIFKGSNLECQFHEDVIMIVDRTPEAPKVQQEKKQLKGTVTDSEGNTLPGVSVVIKGTIKGVATDIDGEYVFEVEGDHAVLVFSFVGMITQEVTYNGQAVQNVSLVADSEQMEEVVVTGYQSISRERATGSFGKINNEIVEEVISDNFVSKLEGQIAGVQVGPDNSIRIRGASTIFGDAKPLIIIDNFPIEGDLKTINPDDIETITVLKDASAASIWGARAGNGVIVITTKKGSKSGKLKITASHFITIEEKPNFSDLNLLSSSQMINLEEEYIEKGWYSVFGTQMFNRSMSLLEEAHTYKSEGIDQFGNDFSESDYEARVKQLKSRDAYRQFEKHLLRKAVKNRSFLSLQGSSDKNNFYLSVSYQNDLFKEKGNENDRFNIQFNNDYMISPRLKFTSNINLNINEAKNNGVSLSSMLNARPYDVLFDESGKQADYYQIDSWTAEEVEEYGYLPYKTNLLSVRDRRDNVSKQLSARLQLGLEYELVDGLSFSTNFQYERGNSKRESTTFSNNPEITKTINNYTSEDDYGNLEYNIPKGDYYQLGNSDFTSWTLRNQMSFAKTVNERHQFNVLAGTEVRSYITTGSSNSYYGYDRQIKSAVPFNQKDASNVFDFTPWIGTPLMFDFNSFSESEDKFFSVYSNFSYTFDERYSLTASARVDKSSSFGDDVKNAPLWSAGLSWNIGNESFFNSDKINRLIVRATYGMSGNIDKQYPPFDLGVLEQGIWTEFPYIYIDNPANPELKWETTTTTNIGVDFAAFNHRLSGSVDLYSKNSEDIVGEVALEGTSGFSSAYKNFADMTNEGIEFSLSGEIIKKKSFSVKAGFNFSYNKNEVTKIYSEGASIRNYLYAVNNETGSSKFSSNGQPVLGKPIDRIYAYNYAGLNNEGEPMLINSDGKKVAWDKFDNDFKSLKYMGSGVAPYHGGFWSSVCYKGLSLKMNFIYQAGGVMRTPAPTYSSLTPSFSSGSRGNVLANLDDRWRKPGDEKNTNILGISPLGSSHMNGYSRYYRRADIFIEKSDFVKLRDVTLEYVIPKKVVDKTLFNNISLKVQAKNLWMWANNPDNIDPESVVSDPYYRLRTSKFPSPKTITVGAKLNF